MSRIFIIALSLLFFAPEAIKADSYLSTTTNKRLYKWDGKHLLSTSNKRLYKWNGTYISSTGNKRLYKWDGTYLLNTAIKGSISGTGHTSAHSAISDYTRSTIRTSWIWATKDFIKSTARYPQRSLSPWSRAWYDAASQCLLVISPRSQLRTYYPNTHKKWTSH